MNSNIVRALFRDALYQVLDNTGFRILAVLFMLPVLLTFAVGVREDGLHLLFIWNYGFEELLSSLGGGGNIENARQITLQFVQQLFVDLIADKFGILFGVAAVAFFVPRMMEKGAADTLFSKPVSRMALFASRYVAGLIFVTLLSVMLVGGMYLGFATVSDYHDVGLLWSIPTLVYAFAVFHAISCLVGVLTRSTIASILLTAVFMVFNGCAHTTWKTVQLNREQSAARDARLLARAASPGDPKDPVAATANAKDSIPVKMLAGALDGLHYALPKTGDSTLIAQGFRKRIEDSSKEFVDDALGLSIAAAPRGFTREPRSSLHREGLLWIAPLPDGGEARWTLKRESQGDVGSRTSLARALRKKLQADAALYSGVTQERVDIAQRVSERTEWVERRGAESRLRKQWIFQIDDSILTLDYDAELGWARGDAQEHSTQVFISGLESDDELTQSSELSYDRRFGWDAPWKYNAWFSVTSTLAFVLMVLGLSWWKLARTDF